MASAPPTTSPRARHHQRRRDRQGLARRRQHRAQHHDHPLELPLRTRAPGSTTMRSTSGGTSARTELNVMFSKRGVLMLAHNVHDVPESFQRHVIQTASTASTTSGSRRRDVQRFLPAARHRSPTPATRSWAPRSSAAPAPPATTPSPGATRAAAARGVDIIQNCPVTAIRRGPTAASPASRPRRASSREEGGGVRRRPHLGGDGDRGRAAAARILPAAGAGQRNRSSRSSRVAMSNAVHAYVSQSDKGELVIGSGTDQYVSYSQRGGLPLIEHTLAAICEVFPIFRRMRMLRKWGGIVDVTPDRSAILGKTPVPASTSIAAGAPAVSRPRPARPCPRLPSRRTSRIRSTRPSRWSAFTTGRLIDEAAAAAVAH